MNRTQWPLLNRARVHGVMMLNEREELETTSIDPSDIIPMNIQYAVDTLPSIEKARSFKMLHEEYFLNTGIRSSFPSMWFEWSSGTMDYAALLLPLGDTDIARLGGFQICVIWDDTTNRTWLKRQPVPVISVVHSVYDIFDDVGMDFVMDNTKVAISKLTDRAMKRAAAKALEEDKTPEDGEQIISQRGFHVCNAVYWSWLLLSCKNVTTVESQPAYRTNKRQKDPCRIVHKELHVQVPPGGNRAHSVSEGDEKAGTAFHVRRGHFADYTQGKGLFGKYHGKYWIPPTTVGDKDYGTVLKNYRLEGVH